MLDNVLIDFPEENYGNNFIFQQDYAPIHAEKLTKRFLEEKNIDVLYWPRLLSHEIYKNGCIYNTFKELKEALITK